jgi:hypothetical protein
MDGILVPITLFISMGVTAIGYPLARAYAKRMERGDVPQIPSDVSGRLERMEQAIDSIAVEVERISEGQRFTTKLLAERVQPSPNALENPPPGGR